MQALAGVRTRDAARRQPRVGVQEATDAAERTSVAKSVPLHPVILHGETRRGNLLAEATAEAADAEAAGRKSPLHPVVLHGETRRGNLLPEATAEATGGGWITKVDPASGREYEVNPATRERRWKAAAKKEEKKGAASKKKAPAGTKIKKKKAGASKTAAVPRRLPQHKVKVYH